LIALDSGDLILWDLRQGTLGVLDRVPVAHRGAILGMDWIGPGEEDGRAWLCTGGLDRTVKVWDMSHSTIPQIPTHTLHTPNGVKRVLWRPEHDTEIAVVPLTSGISPAGGPGAVDDPNAVGGEADKIEVWDVRREWISKYILEAGDGAVAGEKYSRSHSIHVTRVLPIRS
jgi:WD40 repeat protein